MVFFSRAIIEVMVGSFYGLNSDDVTTDSEKMIIFTSTFSVNPIPIFFIIIIPNLSEIGNVLTRTYIKCSLQSSLFLCHHGCSVKTFPCWRFFYVDVLLPLVQKRRKNQRSNTVVDVRIQCVV